MKSFKFKVHDNNYKVKLLSHEGNHIELEVNGTKYDVKLKEEVKKTKTPTLIRSASKRPVEPLKVNPASKRTKIVAPIPGVIMAVDVKIGDTVKVGDRLIQLEAMKMENNITSEKSGKIIALHVSVGQKVLQNEVMIELE
ncbi:biotin/lipoyl-containing protein [Lutimonas zeaxanthinifaciens]|uniref:biotin/lipoyl-containing protein n=1 Tax=Lutimonas zeaxanthinifaciens TaxID=3060215 RepID=UPI00265C9ACD|nr:biotin/lipoyl-containing protein [Lutimonas sp. YSD2104]WKK65542.1 biotin/lipoyl-containing protein [Lutimonas sp. YSD2104]